MAPAERVQVFATLHEPRFADLAPAEVYATLLDEGRYMCSERTFYRILATNAEVRERRNQPRRPHYAAPELLATRPNELWSWDITKLMGPTKWTYIYLDELLDVFSRYVVGRLLAQRESARLAEKLISESCERQEIVPGQLTVHADRGEAMTLTPVALLLADLGVTKSHSRPHASNDNPYSESQFKTLKYRPDFPDRFGSLEQRARVLAAAFAQHPERFTGGLPQPKAVPSALWINPPTLYTMSVVLEETMIRESSPATIVAPARSLEAVLRVNPFSTSIFTEAR